MHVPFPSFPFVLEQNCLLKLRGGKKTDISSDYSRCISMWNGSCVCEGFDSEVIYGCVCRVCGRVVGCMPGFYAHVMMSLCL